MPFSSRFARYLWAAPCSAVGIVVALLYYPFGASVRLANGVLEVAVFGRSDRGRTVSTNVRFSAITLGHIVIGLTHQELKRLRSHELAHVRQYERWGLAFFLAYPLSSLLQLASGRSPYLHNRFGIEARSVAARDELSKLALKAGIKTD